MSNTNLKNISCMRIFFLSLFYIHSKMYHSLLNDDCNKDKIMFIYLQEMIKYNYIDNVRKNKEVCDLSEIEIFCSNNNWIYDNNLNLSSNIKNFYKYFLSNIQNKNINLSNYFKSNYNQIDNVFIELKIFTNNKSSKHYILKDLINSWISENSISEISHIYKLESIHPIILPIHINRNKNTNYTIDINKKIKLFNIKWIIHSIICNHKNNINCYMYDNNKWFLSNDSDKIEEINIKNDIIKKYIQSNCIFINYILFEPFL